jgi:polyisoprenoid-binding protein YceI
MAHTTTWQIDPAHSAVEFAVKHMMFTTVRGRFKNLSGTIEVDEQYPDASRVRVEIEAASIDTGVEPRDNHLRSADFLDVETHPTLRFESEHIRGAAFEEGQRFEVIGHLTLRGKPMEVVLQVTFEGTGRDPWGSLRSGFSVQAEIDRRDWGLQWNQALETGGVLVGNKVTIEIEVQAVKQELPQAAERGTRGRTEEERPSP